MGNEDAAKVTHRCRLGPNDTKFRDHLGHFVGTRAVEGMDPVTLCGPEPGFLAG